MSRKTEHIVRDLADRIEKSIMVRVDIYALTDAEKSLVVKCLRLAAAVVGAHEE